MPKRTRKKSAVKRHRRSPYERSLDYATKRLQKAIAEQMQAQSDLAALDLEIPRLQGIIQALTPEDEREQWQQGIRKEGEEYLRTTPGGNGGVTHISPGDQATFLSRFVKPVRAAAAAGQVLDINVAGKEEPFLPDNLEGREMLP